MSIYAISWVLIHSETTLGCRLVMLAIADYAQDDGSRAYPSVESIAKKARLSERQVQRNLQTLIADGHLALQGVSQYGTKVYRIVGMGGDITSPPPSGGVTSTTGSVHEMSPNPSSNPSRTTGENAGERERESVLPGFEPPIPSKPSKKTSVPKVGRDPITVDERVLAEAAIGHFNSVTGKDLRFLTSGGAVTEATRLIVCRMRAYPDLQLAKHKTIIENTIASKWWGETPPSINVVYGPGVFEQNIARKRTTGARVVETDPRAAERLANLRAHRIQMEQAAAMAAGGSTT